MAARAFRQQIGRLDDAEGTADQVERLVHRTWRQLLELLQAHGTPDQNLPIYTAVRALLSPFRLQLANAIADDVRAAAKRSYDLAADTVAQQLPVDRHVGEARLTERKAKAHGILVTPRGVLLPNTPRTKKQAADVIRELIFPPPSEEQVNRVVFGSGWVDRLAAQTSLATPDAIANKVLQSISSGKSINDLARSLLPIFDDVRTSARRVARDTTMAASHAMQHEAWNQVGELIVGYQINAVLDERTRPKHYARAGQVFYKNPTGDQKGMDECPQPPLESPKDGSVHAFNCRCFLTPVMRLPDEVGAQVLAHAPLDRQSTADWFDDASLRHQRIAIGAERHDLMTALLGRQPSWFDVTDDSGQLIPVDRLRRRLAA